MIRSRPVAIMLGLLFLADAALIALHFAFGWSVINLDEEGNLAAWYSSAKLLALAVFCAWLWREERRQRLGRLAVLWLVVGWIFLGLSMDETASLHERLARAVMKETRVGLDIRETVLAGDAARDAFAWVLLLSPFIAATVALFAIVLYGRLFRARAGFLPALLGLACFVTAVGLEATIYFAPPLREWGPAHLAAYQEGIQVEEAAELLGSTLFLLGFSRYSQHLVRRRASMLSAPGPAATL